MARLKTAEWLAQRQAELRASLTPGGRKKPRLRVRKKTRAELAELSRLRYVRKQAEWQERRLAAAEMRIEMARQAEEERAARREQRREAARAAELRHEQALRDLKEEQRKAAAEAAAIERRAAIPHLCSRPGVPHEPPYSPVEAEARRIHLQMHMPEITRTVTALKVDPDVAADLLAQVALDILEGRAYAWDAEFDRQRARRFAAGDTPREEWMPRRRARYYEMVTEGRVEE